MRFPGRRKYKRKSKWGTGPTLCIPPDPALDNLLASWGDQCLGRVDPGLIPGSMIGELKRGDMCKMGALEGGPLLASAARSQLLRAHVQMLSGGTEKTGFEHKEQ